jgi:type I restriction enzyme S subunit
MSWELMSLLNVTSRIGDGLHGTPKYDENGEYYFINGNNLEQGKVGIKAETKKINNEEFQKIKKNLNERTVFVSINGTLGNVGLYNGEKIALGKSACYLNINQDVSKYYIRYILENENFQSYAERFATGATIKNLGLKAIRNYEFLLPPLPTQKKIASILSAYDDLIENNLKRIQLLEETAQRIYKEWFVDFKFPNYENIPINNETSLPEGWKNVNLGDISILKYGKMPKAEKKMDKGYVIFTGYREVGYYQEKMFGKPTLIVVARGVGGTGDVKISPRNCWLTNLSIAVLNRYDSILQGYLYFYLRASHLRMLDSGAAQSQITINALEKVNVIVPEYNLQLIFQTKFDNISTKFENLKKQNQSLKEARDLLLPRLMNRTLEV